MLMRLPYCPRRAGRHRWLQGTVESDHSTTDMHLWSAFSSLNGNFEDDHPNVKDSVLTMFSGPLERSCKISCFLQPSAPSHWKVRTIGVFFRLGFQGACSRWCSKTEHPGSLLLFCKLDFFPAAKKASLNCEDFDTVYLTGFCRLHGRQRIRPKTAADRGYICSKEDIASRPPFC